MRIRFSPNRRMHSVRMQAQITASLSPARVPWRVRSRSPAPMFWPAKVVMAVPKVKLGIMANPSTRMTTVVQAMTAVPMELVRDCTTIIAREKMPCVMPEGRPRRASCRA